MPIDQTMLFFRPLLFHATVNYSLQIILIRVLSCSSVPGSTPSSASSSPPLRAHSRGCRTLGHPAMIHGKGLIYQTGILGCKKHGHAFSVGMLYQHEPLPIQGRFKLPELLKNKQDIPHSRSQLDRRVSMKGLSIAKGGSRDSSC